MRNATFILLMKQQPDADDGDVVIQKSEEFLSAFKNLFMFGSWNEGTQSNCKFSSMPSRRSGQGVWCHTGFLFHLDSESSRISAMLSLVRADEYPCICALM